MNSFSRSIFEHFCNSWEYKAILLYIMIGCFFTTAQMNGLGYVELFFSTLTNKIFLIVVLYPSFLVMYFLIFRFINKNQSVLLRLYNRKNFSKYNIVNMIFMSMFLYFQVLLIILICCNLIKNTGFEIDYSIGYDVNDIVITFTSIIKIFLTIISIGLLNLFLQLRFETKNISFIILLIILMLLFFGDKVYPTNNVIIDTFNPSFHSHGYMFENSFFKLIVTSIIYFSFVIPVLLFAVFKSSKKANLGL